MLIKKTTNFTNKNSYLATAMLINKASGVDHYMYDSITYTAV